MPDDNNTTPSSGQGATPAPGSPATGSNASPGAMPAVKPATTLEEALARIAELERHSSNKEEQATRHGKELTAAQKELAAYKEKERLAQEATLSEVQKAAKRAEEAEAQLQQYRQQLVISKVQIAATAKGIIDPELAEMAIRDKLELDAQGLPTNIEKLLDELLKNKPYLAAKTEAQTTTPAQQPRPPQTPAMNPGRSAIQQPGQATLPRNQWPRLGDVLK